VPPPPLARMKSGNPPTRKDTTMTAPTPRLKPLLPMALGLVLAGAGAGCELGTRGEGAVKTEAREVAAFSRIETSAGIDVSVTFDPTPSLEVHAQENLLPLIVAEVKDDTLHLRTTQPYTTTEKVEVVLTTPSLTRLVLSGGSHGQITDLQAEDLELELSGGSRLDATGKATNLTLGMSGGSAAGLQDLETKTIEVDASGGCNATVRASGEVRGSATGGSRITVIGEAALSVDTTGNSYVGR
jgi:hypothetical protein